MGTRVNIWKKQGKTAPVFQALSNMLHDHRGRFMAFADMHLEGYCGDLMTPYRNAEYVKRDADFKEIILRWASTPILTFTPDGKIVISQKPSNSWDFSDRKYHYRMTMFVEKLNKAMADVNSPVRFGTQSYTQILQIGSIEMKWPYWNQHQIDNNEKTEQELIDAGVKKYAQFNSTCQISADQSRYDHRGNVAAPCGRNGQSYYDTCKRKVPRTKKEYVRVHDHQNRRFVKSMTLEGITGYAGFQWDMPKEDGTPGEWHEIPEGTELQMCANGIHVCTPDDIQNWTSGNGKYIVEMEIDGPVLEQNDRHNNKYICRKARVIKVLGCADDLNRLYRTGRTWGSGIRCWLRGNQLPEPKTYKVRVPITGYVELSYTSKTLKEAKQAVLREADYFNRHSSDITLTKTTKVGKPKRVRDGEA